MKIFKDTTHWNSRQILKEIRKFYAVIFVFGFLIGLSIIMAADALKQNDSESVLMMFGFATILVFITAFLYSFVHYKLIPELEKRLK